MAYNPSGDILATPAEVGELYVAVQELVVAQGTWTLGNPDQAAVTDLDKPTYRHENFYGWSGIVVGDVCEISEFPIASYPPTHRLTVRDEAELAELHILVPDARDVLSVGRGGVQVLHHETYIKHLGGKEVVDPEAKPQPPDCAFIFEGPANPDLTRRVYRIVPQPGEPGARGVRTDIHGRMGPLRDPATRLFPDMRKSEFDCLMRLVRCTASLATARELGEPERKPQEE